MMNIFLRQVEKDFRQYFVIMLLDQAGWHKSKKLQIPENIRLIEQPSHSPELNPAEHIWDEIREKNFHNRAFDTLDGVERALCRGLKALHQNPFKISSMTNFAYLNITV